MAIRLANIFFLSITEFLRWTYVNLLLKRCIWTCHFRRELIFIPRLNNFISVIFSSVLYFNLYSIRSKFDRGSSIEEVAPLV